MRKPEREADETSATASDTQAPHSSAYPLSKPLLGFSFARSLTPNCKGHACERTALVEILSPTSTKTTTMTGCAASVSE